MKKCFPLPLRLLFATLVLVALVPILLPFHFGYSSVVHANGISITPTQVLPSRIPSTYSTPDEGISQYCNKKNPCYPPLKWYGGPILHHPHVMMIFWGHKWGDSTNKHYPTYAKIVKTEEMLFKNLAGSHYNNLLTQYYDKNGHVVNDKNVPVFQGATLGEADPPTINDDSIANEISAAIKANPNWANVTDGQFMLFPQEGSTYSDTSRCGAHGVDKNNHLFSFVAYLGDSSFATCLSRLGSNIVNGMTVTSSHEYAEIVTDPYIPSTIAWLDQKKANEIGDLCAYEYKWLSELGGVVVQKLFDNNGYAIDHSQGCVTSGKFTEYAVPTPNSQPSGITKGPDGNLWFTETYGDKIGKITPGGTITEYPIPTSPSYPYGITAGSDGNLWFTEYGGSKIDKIGKITPGGTITEYPIPTSNSSPSDITAGPDGNLWFTELANKIGKITPGGTITEYPIPTSKSFPYGITSGPDGNLWFTELYGNKIGKITPGGTITEYPTPTSNSNPYGITSGPDGNLWFTELNANKIGKITPGGTITEYPTPTSNPYGITAGPDGNLWCTDYYGNKIGKITPGGTITEYSIPTSNSSPYGITAGPDGNLWFTEQNANKIGNITPK